MKPFHICKRICVHSKGDGSQTLRITTDSCQHGIYDWAVRFKSTADLQHELRSADTSSIEKFVIWLRDNPNLQGEIERVPPDQDALLVTNRKKPACETSEFEAAATAIVEQALDRLVLDFLRAPFRHRTENNLHCEAYGRLLQSAILADLHQIASGQNVQLVHREWPEKYAKDRPRVFRLNEIWPLSKQTESRTPNVVRGKYDLAVLSPQSVKDCQKVDRYADGIISPVVAIEFGLNERYKHLRSDVAKLNSNDVPFGYVVHFLRPGANPDNIKQTERLFELLAKNNNVKGAYAHVDSGSGSLQYRYKLVGEAAITISTALPS